jgi:hypothetical protein
MRVFYTSILVGMGDGWDNSEARADPASIARAKDITLARESNIGDLLGGEETTKG